jgi:ribosomal protein S18 acetylase RimI-like enzyme
MTEADFSAVEAWERDRPYPWTRRQLSDAMTASMNRVWIVEDGQNGVAYAAVQRVPPEAYLMNVAVAPERRRQGWGRKTLEAVFAALRQEGISTLFLDVEKGNAPALALYASLGFETVGRRLNAYPRGEEAALMRRSL